MGLIHTLEGPPRLSEQALEALCRQMTDAAAVMSDDQILRLADALHDTLRARRALRHRLHQRVERRLDDERGTAASA
ncbi:hypothetical protein BZG35_04945 [Brevundimonas sp. LM2]|uniref:hypothetical protein n=1 Tax=Brevundimonas sp. LM2 TaxID=1938605 RepID=UPI000983EFD8|nr:hypothetical protein [Brevundimonas sp. LM2]AQR61082.1 hypothetical protein BZG35_04945 [Brevundimonas sp. LM2]